MSEYQHSALNSESSHLPFGRTTPSTERIRYTVNDARAALVQSGLLKAAPLAEELQRYSAYASDGGAALRTLGLEALGMSDIPPAR